MGADASSLASIVAIVGLTATLLKTTKQLWNASNEIFALENELNDIQVLVKQIEVLCREPWPESQQHILQQAEDLLQDVIKQSLESLQSTLQKWTQRYPKKLRRCAWIFIQSKIDQDRRRIREAKQQLFSLFHLSNVSSTHRIGFETTQLTVEVQGIRETQKQTQNLMLKRLESNVNSPQVPLISGEELIRQIQFLHGNFEHILQNATRTQDLSSLALGELIKDGPKTVQVTELELSRKSTNTTSAGSPITTCQDNETIISRVLEGQDRPCRPMCACACHGYQTTFANPGMTEMVAGQFVFGVSIHSLVRPKCNIAGCKRGGRSFLRLRYKFPTWFLAYSLTLFASFKQAPEFVLRMPRVRRCNDGIFEAVAHARIDHIKEQFSSGKASIYDVEDTGGHTLLHRALLSRNMRTVGFLLTQGADVDAVNQKKNSCCDIFWRLLLSNWLSASEYEPFVSSFPDTSYIDDGDFTVVHKIVFQESTLDLSEFLKHSPSLIDKRDAYGRTPLHWAAARGDLHTVMTLLDHDADPNLIERGGWTPLHNSILTTRPEVSRVLLERGADPNKASKIWNDQALHITCHGPDFHCHIPALLEHGADTSAASTLRDSPLQFAALRNYPQTVKALIEHTPREKHTNAIISAIENQAVESLQVLLECKAHCQSEDADGRTILHHAGMQARTPVLEVLARFKSQLPSASTDHSGWWPQDYANTRRSEEFSDHYWSLLVPSQSDDLSKFPKVLEVELEDEVCCVKV